jgi:phosphate transport system permease protein
MLFGAPLALLAAIYTSEFLNPRLRARIKPMVEIMASLPSVVLGFLAGLVIAPAAEKVVPAILATFFMMPFVLLLAAHLWQLLPIDAAVRLAPWRFPSAILALPAGVGLAMVVGPAAERLMFRGDLKGWLNVRFGTGTPGWFIILLPLSALLTSWFFARSVNPWLRSHSVNWNRLQSGLVELLKFVAGCLVVVAVALVVALLLNSVGLDPRGSFVGTYVQRNALIVGFMMGFAVIPLIYTIADDALTSVPTHLRSASLGAGATQWQTAVRIVIPTAMSGLFSALMIGLGRAVGETMIVLMAAGNTPIMEWNIFNGFQTLSATIATELPEAPRDSTHYRTLFLAALVLFILTFIVNTFAEMVRLRFRRRAHEL